MDKWKDSEVEKMKVGGNKQAHEFFSSQSDINPSMTISEKYNSRAAALYRDKILALSEGRKNWSIDTSDARRYNPPQKSATLTKKEITDMKEEFFHKKLQENAQRPADVLPSQGGRYTGFGNTPLPDANHKEDSHDFMANTWSTLSTGWSHFTSGASALASQAGEKAVQLGSALDTGVIKPSAQQATKLGRYVQETVIKPAKEKVQEGHLWESVTTAASTWASKVKDKGSELWTKSQQAGDGHAQQEGREEEEEERLQGEGQSDSVIPSGKKSQKQAAQVNWDETWDEQKGWDERSSESNVQKKKSRKKTDRQQDWNEQSSDEKQKRNIEQKVEDKDERGWDLTWNEQIGWDEQNSESNVHKKKSSKKKVKQKADVQQDLIEIKDEQEDGNENEGGRQNRNVGQDKVEAKNDWDETWVEQKGGDKPSNESNLQKKKHRKKKVKEKDDGKQETLDEWDGQKTNIGEPKIEVKNETQRNWDETWDEQKGWDEAQWEDVKIRTSEQN